MTDETDHSDELVCAEAIYAATEDAPIEEFKAHLTARYRRLSLLTLDLAEKAGKAALCANAHKTNHNCAKAHKTNSGNFSLVESQNKVRIFERRTAAMTRAIWAHQQIERLRRGGVIERAHVAHDDRVAASGIALLARGVTQHPLARACASHAAMASLDDDAGFATGLIFHDPNARMNCAESDSQSATDSALVDEEAAQASALENKTAAERDETSEYIALPHGGKIHKQNITAARMAAMTTGPP